MEIKHLFNFYTIVNEGNISAAAKKLNMSQPPLSTQMKQLEDELRTSLFIRGSRRIELTDTGKMLYNRIPSILSLCDSITKDISSYEEGTSGILRIGAVSSLSNTLLADYLDKFKKVNPNVSFEISEGNTYEMLELIENGLIELALIRSPFSENNINCSYLKEENIVAVACSSMINSGKDDLSLRDLSKCPLIIYRRWEKVLDDAFLYRNIPMNIYCKCDDARTALSLAKKGLGIALVPGSITSSIDDRNLRVLNIRDLNIRSRIAVACNKSHTLSALGKAFYDFLSVSED